MERYYLIKILTNSAGQDGTTIENYDDNLNSAIVNYHNTLASYHNAQDVLFATVKIENAYGVQVSNYCETVDHSRPETNTEE